MTSNGDSSNYATLRKPPMSPKTSLSNKQPRTPSHISPMATTSFRLPPPLSSTSNASQPPSNQDSLSSSRTRSLENINANEKTSPPNSMPLDAEGSPSTNGYSLQHNDSISSQYAPRTNQMTNLQLLGDANLSSSTESTNGLPFANENVGTIKQRSPYNQNLYNSSLDPMKRSLPIQFFEQSNPHLMKTSYPMSTAIYDNNERLISTNISSPRKLSTLTPAQINGNNPAILTGEKRLQYLEMMKKDRPNKIVK